MLTCVKTRTCIERALGHIKNYGRASGAKINEEKSELMVFKQCDIPSNAWGLKTIETERKILGIFIGKDEKSAMERTWKEVLGKIKNLLNLWYARGLNLKGKVIVVNALILSKINHILGSCELPTWVLNSLNKAISTFFWKGKANLIARRTLIANKREGGLALIDISVKRDALRLKLMGRYLNAERQLPWKDFLTGLLTKYGERGVYNLCAFTPRNIKAGLSGFYREVLEAWDKLLPHLRPDVKGKAQVLRLPFLSNPSFVGQGRPLINCHLSQAGLTAVGSVCGKNGMFDLVGVKKRLRVEGRTYRMQRLKIIKGIFDDCMRKEWIGRMGVDVVRDKPLGFFLCLDDKLKSIEQIQTKIFYSILIKKEISKPAAEKSWAKVFPGHQLNRIWSNIEFKFIPPGIFNSDFKIRHRRIFTSIVLHQIHKDKFNRMCAVCGKEEEDFEHLILCCSALKVFRAYIKDLVTVGCGVKDMTGILWDWTWCFGLPKTRVGQETGLPNTCLAFARQAVLIRRNYALFENKTMDLKRLFANSIKAHWTTLYAYKKDLMEDYISEENKLFWVDDGNGIVFSF